MLVVAFKTWWIGGMSSVSAFASPPEWDVRGLQSLSGSPHIRDILENLEFWD